MHEKGLPRALWRKRRCLKMVMKWTVTVATPRPLEWALAMASVEQTPRGRAGPEDRACCKGPAGLPPGCWAWAPCLPGEQGQPQGSCRALGLGCSRQPPAVLDVSLAGFDGEDDKRSENSIGPCNQGQR